jgi:hypothetical protein
VFRTFFMISFVALAAPQMGWAAPTFSRAVTNGIVNIPLLTEASGIAASRNNPGVL